MLRPPTSNGITRHSPVRVKGQRSRSSLISVYRRGLHVEGRPTYGSIEGHNYDVCRGATQTHSVCLCTRGRIMEGGGHGTVSLAEVLDDRRQLLMVLPQALEDLVGLLAGPDDAFALVWVWVWGAGSQGCRAQGLGLGEMMLCRCWCGEATARFLVWRVGGAEWPSD